MTSERETIWRAGLASSRRWTTTPWGALFHVGSRTPGWSTSISSSTAWRQQEHSEGAKARRARASSRGSAPAWRRAQNSNRVAAAFQRIGACSGALSTGDAVVVFDEQGAR